MKYKEMIKALNAIEDERRIPEEVVIEALKEAMAKAYKKDAELSDINVEAEINEKKQTIDIYQLYNVVENVEDDELEMDLEEARKWKRDACLNDVVRRQVEITTMSRAAATLARNVMRQKIREAEKVAVYDAYIDQLYEMVIGVVESVKDKFALINLGKTTALMPKSAQIPGERLTEGQRIRVVITEVNKDTKGSQVLVSRADPMLVKRLFEKEVPEISNGVVEIKAIAREAGERTKMAVVSYNPEVDPIGACIGQRGGRVQEIIEELHGEKIDIFQWNDDITMLVKNAFAPAEVDAVLPGDDDKSLFVIVDEDQLSLAIGKRGKNARLAVKLTNRKIDIKTKSELAEMGKDYDALVREAEERRAIQKAERERREAERLEAKAREEEENRKAASGLLEARRRASEAVAAAIASEDVIPEEMQEIMSDKIRFDIANEPEQEKEEPAAAAAEEAPEEEIEAAAEIAEEPEAEMPEEPEEEPAEEPEEEPAEEPDEEPEEVQQEEEPAPVKTEQPKPARKKVDLEEIASQNTYVSVFEKLADTSKPKQQTPSRKKKKKDEDTFKVRNKVLEQQLAKNISVDIKPVYTEGELEESERQQGEEEEAQYDIDYDEYEDYYDED
ncbi:MAG: transcription termination factor NusA [Solobacterium sp.]|nr:transcription termination factor NusA [Solobacterium sp.]